MFTGLVAEVGTVVGVESVEGASRLLFAGDALVREVRVGDSVAVSGACLTAIEVDGGRFAADVVAETLRRTTLGALGVGDHVNLELPLRAADRIGGHFVLGHVDDVAVVRELSDAGELVVEMDPSLVRYVVEKGSIALDGVSLTVAAVEGPLVTVALIPQTRRATTLGLLAQGSRVNVEVDILAKHLEKLVVR
ncbi:MAG: riboflavin synthase [Solirubrobacteraceae bacterium]|jgi:riboflavin synthase